MEVKLLTPTEFIKVMGYNAAYAMLTCHANTEQLENEEPKTFIKKAVKMGHESILEHITLTYEVKELSRTCLQELARHRHISLSVESTRHTLKKILEENIDDGGAINEAFLERFDTIEKNFIHELFSLFEEVPSISNDELKYYIPEFWTTNLIMTANIRELRHIMKLRTSPAALKEFQILARKFVEVLPEEFKYLLADCVYHDRSRN